ncbi:hypothetical protein O4J56_06305 [Nocardiopsis sp. RSe5-2]|uniref:DUF3040 domain-containing protein n=1 Tax=Nocardiopsis endophytica TaxID=3018445 RepID=A0ABT4U0P0_9ACTN|nr:hypothetical protein [Nocardiopsis endophytica]MDA2810246.1 hypothetical protein [Nocardiopsis endophytica]
MTDRREREEAAGRDAGRYDARIRGYQREGGRFAPTSSHRGRGRSWAGVALVVAGALAAALAMVTGTPWLLAAAAVAALAGLAVCVAGDIFTDVVLDDPHRESEEPHTTPLHKIKERDRELEAERRRAGA